MGIGDGIVFLAALAALAYGIYVAAIRKTALYFKLILCAIFCHILGYLFDICEYYTINMLSEGFTIGYLGTFGCFLFLLTASLGYMDGILDDRTSAMKKSRRLAAFAPVITLIILIPNFFAEIPLSTKICYSILWAPAIISSYFNLKHAIIPDMGFGFVKAIRPFNISALAFTELQLIHLTLWNFSGWIPLLISGVFLGTSTIIMMILAQRGVAKWAI